MAFIISLTGSRLPSHVIGDTPSLISGQIEIISRKIVEIEERLKAYGPLPSPSKETIEWEAIDCLAYCRDVLSNLAKPCTSRDAHIKYFNALNNRIAIEENPTPLEITRCQELLRKITESVDLSKAEELISYQDAASTMGEVDAKIGQITSRCLPSMKYYGHASKAHSVVFLDNWQTWDGCVKELDLVIKTVHSMITNDRSGIINSFTLEGRDLFMKSAVSCIKKVKEVTSVAEQVTQRKGDFIQRGSQQDLLRKSIISTIGQITSTIKDIES